jgi:hypothetical protein
MTQEDKNLLLQDLCARLPYGVKVTTRNPAAEFGVISGISIKGKISVGTKDADIVFECTEVKPFLRPMSSMTKEEEKEYHTIIMQSQDCSFENGESATTMVNDWFLSKHFDVRGLIPKELALEAPKGMYKKEE